MTSERTASKIHRIWQCPASAVLPRHTNEDLDARNEPARGRGKEIHKYLERVRVVGVETALAEVPEDLRLLCMTLDIDRLPTDLSTEVAFAWNWQTHTARELGRNLGHRDYDSLGVDWTCEIPGTWDVVGMREFGHAGTVIRRGYVGDYKSGWSKYPRPGRFGQTLLGASCIRSAMGLDDVIVELLHIDDDGESYQVRDLVDAWVLDPFERELGAVMEDLPRLGALVGAHGPDAAPKHQGPHCKHCPGFKSCSAQTALVRAVPEELLRLGVKRDEHGHPIVAWVPGKKEGEGKWALDVTPGAITVRNAAAVYEACERVESICRRMRDEVCGIAYHEPIELSDGRVIERYSWKRRKVDGRIAAAVLEKHYGRDKVLAKLGIELPLSAIEDLVRENVDWKAKPRPVVTSKKGTGILDGILREIEGARGLATDQGEECKPRQPRRAKGK